MKKNLHWISSCRLGVGNTFCLYGLNRCAEPELWLLVARCSSLLLLCVLFLLGIWIPYTTFHQLISNYFSLLRALQIDLRNYFLLVEVLAKVLLRKRIWEEPQLLLYTVIYMHTHTHTYGQSGGQTDSQRWDSFAVLQLAAAAAAWNRLHSIRLLPSIIYTYNYSFSSYAAVFAFFSSALLSHLPPYTHCQQQWSLIGFEWSAIACVVARWTRRSQTNALALALALAGPIMCACLPGWLWAKLLPPLCGKLREREREREQDLQFTTPQ